MKKREVTDEMVERAWTDFQETARSLSGMERMRAAIRAAINPPEEPEVVMTREMLDAGVWAAMGYPCHTESLARVAAGAIYRAMRRLEPKAEQVNKTEQRTGPKDRRNPDNWFVIIKQRRNCLQPRRSTDRK